MHQRLSCALGIALLSWLLSARGFELGEPYFETVGDAETLAYPYGAVTALVQDPSGLLWVGTHGGVFRYDGYRLRRLHDREGTGVEEAYVRDLHVDSESRLWIATSIGLFIHDSRSGATQAFHHDPARPESLADDSLYALTDDGHGGVWIGGNGGLDQFNPDQEGFKHSRLHPTSDADNSDEVRSLLRDHQGELWVGGLHGLYRRSLDSDEVVAPMFSDVLGEQSVWTVFEASDQSLWVGTQFAGAFRIDPTRSTLQALAVGQNTDFEHAYVRSFAEAEPGKLWIASYGSGIAVVDASNGAPLRRIRHDPLLPGGLAIDFLGALLLDRSGLLWVGTWGEGVQRHNPGVSAFRSLRRGLNDPASLSQADVYSVLEDLDGLIWVGLDGGGIDLLDRERGVIGGFRSNPEDPSALGDGTVSGLALTTDGSLWVGTQQAGLHRYQRNSRSFQRFRLADGLVSDSVRRLLPSHSGGLWIGTNEGLSRWDPAAERIGSALDSTGRVVRRVFWTLVEDAQGRLWAGSPNGLSVVESGEWPLLRTVLSRTDGRDALSSPQVRSLMIDREGRLWIDTAGGLDRLIEWDGTAARFESVATRWGRSGSAGGAALGGNMQQDASGRIWTARFVFDPATGQVEEFGRADGVDLGTNWAGSCATTRDGLLLYGGTKGLLIIDPRLFHFQASRYQPPVVVTELVIDGEEQFLAAESAGFTLSSEQRRFSMEFSALDFSAPERNRYAYRLDGYDRDWIHANARSRVASYGGLWPGNYTLRVRGSNRLGEWSPHEISMPITVLPDFWQTLWFAGLLLLVASAGLYSGFRWRTERIRKRARDLQHQVDERTAQLGTANADLATANRGLASAHSNLSSLSAIGRELTAKLDLEAVLESLHHRVDQMMDANVFGVGLYRPERAEIEIQFAIEDGQRYQPYSRSMADKNQLAVYCIEKHRPIRIGNYEHDVQLFLERPDVVAGQPLVDGSRAKQPVSLLYVPMLLNDAVIGMMTVQSFARDAYQQIHVDMLQTLAAYAAIAIDNARAHAALGVANRSLLDTQVQMVQQEKMAALGTLTAGVAHEINNPTNFIAGSAQNLEHQMQRFRKFLHDLAGKDADPEVLEALDRELGPQSEQLQNILEGAQRIRAIVLDLRQFTRLDEADRKRIAIAEPIQSTVNLIRTRFDRIRFSLNLEFNPTIECQPAKLGQVFMNLIVNACEAIEHAAKQRFEDPAAQRLKGHRVDDHKGVVAISTTLVEGGQTGSPPISSASRFVQVEVADNGCGIEPAVCERVFEPFFTTKGVGAGTGLGLAISFGIVADHGGRIEVRSTPGIGSRFLVLLPIGV